MVRETNRVSQNSSLSVNSRLGSLLGVQIVGLGSYLPENRLRNEDLADLGYDPQWILQRTGIQSRHHSPPGIATSDLASRAAEKAIADAGINPAEIDLLLLGTYTPDMLMPGAASLVQEKLHLSAPAFDIPVACASFAYALLTGMQFVATGTSRRVLVIGADCNSRIINPDDKQTYPLFGDGAGAVILAPGETNQGALAFAFGSDGSGANLLNRPMGGTQFPFNSAPEHSAQQFLRMDGRPIFKWAVRMLQETSAQVLEKASLTIDQVDWVVFHQANKRILDMATNELGIDPQKVVCNVDRYGNTSSASIPLALCELHQKGLLKAGQRILLSGFGAGLAWGTMLFQW